MRPLRGVLRSMGRSAGSSGVGSQAHVGEGQEETVEKGRGGRFLLGEAAADGEAHEEEDEKSRCGVDCGDRAACGLHLIKAVIVNGEEEEEDEEEENLNKAGRDDRRPAHEATETRRAGPDILEAEIRRSDGVNCPRVSG
jgi:hypothetical protein